MIEHITTSAFFPSSGARLNGKFQPGTGITAVVGDNGSGKTTMSIEACRWLLFGKAALRGPAPDYRDASVTGVVRIRGARYEIARGKSEWIKDDSGAMVAKGAEQVTAYVTAAMGYGLDVFDLCNAATQGNVQALGNMRAGERKAIIDKVLRLTDAEKAEKDCREEAKGLKREAEALTKTLRAPGDAPVAPAGYRPSSAARELIRQMREDIAAADALRVRLRAADAPVKPVVGEFSETAIDELQDHEDRRRRVAGERAQLNSVLQRAMPYSPENWSEEQLVAAEKRAAIHHVLNQRGPAPQLTAPQSEANWSAWALYDAHKPSDPIKCPKCAHTFYTTGVPPQQPAWTKTALRADDARRAKHASPEPTMPDGPDIEQRVIDHARAARKASEEFELARTRLNELPTLADESAKLAQMRRDKAALEAYSMELLRYERVRAENRAVQHDLDALGHLPTSDELHALYEELSVAERYEADCRSYDAEDVAFKATTTKITETSNMAEQYRLGAAGIADARAVVKALIAPKISRVASALINHMTMGKLTSVVVDEEMEITVGGQRIETLSGAGKTVANLALRIAFGRALVGKVFPVFLADEIDGDLTAARRAATLQAMVGLKEHMSQIVLVTHRGAEIADQVWDVDE